MLYDMSFISFCTAYLRFSYYVISRKGRDMIMELRTIFFFPFFLTIYIHSNHFRFFILYDQ